MKYSTPVELSLKGPSAHEETLEGPNNHTSHKGAPESGAMTPTIGPHRHSIAARLPVGSVQGMSAIIFKVTNGTRDQNWERMSTINQGTVSESISNELALTKVSFQPKSPKQWLQACQLGSIHGERAVETRIGVARGGFPVKG